MCGCAEHAKDGGVILVIGHGKRGGMCIKQTGTVQTYGSSQTTCIRPRVIVSAVIPSKHANGTIRVRCNVEEVDVPGTVVVEVVVLSVLGDGSSSRRW